MSDVDIRKIFEETTTRNVKAGIDHGNETRNIVRELEGTVGKLQAQIRLQDEKFKEIKKQLGIIQTKVFSGGT